jgi:SAM-dependent methyltransferase
MTQVAMTAPQVGQLRLDIFQRILEPLTPGRLLDLGAGHGKFSLIARDLGWKVTAVDARTERMPMSEGIDWVQADVRDFDTEGFDCICILGLLYHLELEDQLSLLSRCAPTFTIIDTHVAPRVTHVERGYEGYLFAEQTEATTASWGNPWSFWPTEESLITMLHESGYHEVYPLAPSYEPDRHRTFYICT